MEKEKQSLISRINRIQGQLESIKKGLEDDADLECIKTMHLIKAANNALKKFGEEYVSMHMEKCMNGKSSKKDMEKELRSVIEAAFTL
jgi:DNA-binding FrmR family transcriptional regulator